MNIFEYRLLLAALLPLVLAACSLHDPFSGGEPSRDTRGEVRLQLIRNATLKIEYAGTRFLVDPMLAEKGAYPGFRGTLNSHLPNPLVGLPMPLSEAIDTDAVILTHTHLDHWDDAAKQHLPKSMPIFVQDNTDAATVRSAGFEDVRVLEDSDVFGGTRLTRIGGQHGTDAHMSKLGALLGNVSGVVLERPGYETTYIVGDTIWRPEVEAAIGHHEPDLIVLNIGHAQIMGFDGSIIMGKDDLSRAQAIAPHATLIGVHMEATNHSAHTRQTIKRHITQTGLDTDRILVPNDGQLYLF